MEPITSDVPPQVHVRVWIKCQGRKSLIKKGIFSWKSELRAERLRKGSFGAVGIVPYCGQNKKIQRPHFGSVVIKASLSVRAAVISIYYHPVCPPGYGSCAGPVPTALRPPHVWKLKALIYI